VVKIIGFLFNLKSLLDTGNRKIVNLQFVRIGSFTGGKLLFVFVTQGRYIAVFNRAKNSISHLLEIRTFAFLFVQYRANTFIQFTSSQNHNQNERGHMPKFFFLQRLYRKKYKISRLVYNKKNDDGLWSCLYVLGHIYQLNDGELVRIRLALCRHIFILFYCM
jgi:hypothetical protein